jgi:hypothetical protein
VRAGGGYQDFRRSTSPLVWTSGRLPISVAVLLTRPAALGATLVVAAENPKPMRGGRISDTHGVRRPTVCLDTQQWAYLADPPEDGTLGLDPAAFNRAARAGAFRIVASLDRPQEMINAINASRDVVERMIAPLLSLARTRLLQPLERGADRCRRRRRATNSAGPDSCEVGTRDSERRARSRRRLQRQPGRSWWTGLRLRAPRIRGSCAQVGSLSTAAGSADGAKARRAPLGSKPVRGDLARRAGKSRPSTSASCHSSDP